LRFVRVLPSLLLGASGNKERERERDRERERGLKRERIENSNTVIDIVPDREREREMNARNQQTGKENTQTKGTSCNFNGTPSAKNDTSQDHGPGRPWQYLRRGGYGPVPPAIASPPRVITRFGVAEKRGWPSWTRCTIANDNMTICSQNTHVTRHNPGRPLHHPRLLIYLGTASSGVENICTTSRAHNEPSKPRDPRQSDVPIVGGYTCP